MKFRSRFFPLKFRCCRDFPLTEHELQFPRDTADRKGLAMDESGMNVQRVPYHSERWDLLVSLGWMTARVEINQAMSDIAIMVREENRHAIL